MKEFIYRKGDVFLADLGIPHGSEQGGKRPVVIIQMERRVNAIQANGTDAMIEVFQGLPHGFGIGTGTAAEGWIENAVEFWERNMEQ